MTIACSKIQKNVGIPRILKLVLIFLGSLLLVVSLANGQQTKDTKRVLILITGQMGLPGYELAREEIIASLDQSVDYECEYFIEYMDYYRFQSASYYEDLHNLYRAKYAGEKIDLIVAHGYQALDFIAGLDDDLFSGTPVVFSTVFESQRKRLDPEEKFTGSFLEIDYAGLWNTALNNHPDARNVVVISGTSKVSRLIEKQARKTYEPYANKYEITYLGSLPMQDMLDELSKVPEHTVVLYYHLARDGKGEAYKPWKVAARIAEAANAPVYGFADTYLGTGIVGGTLISYKALGSQAGQIGLRVLNGEKPAEIPASSEGTILKIFDWRQLKRWGVHESDLPEGSIVRYKDLSFWELYHWYIIGTILLLLLQGAIIFALVNLRKKSKKEELMLRASEDRYRAFVETSSEQIWCVEFDEPIHLDLSEDEQFELVYKYGYISEANDAYARSIGFNYGKELKGARLEDFISRSDPRNVAAVKAWIQGRYTILNAETIESYKEGVERVILNNASGFIEAGRVVRVWGTATDITDLRDMEEGLHKAEEKYRFVADHTYDWEWWKSPDGTFRYVSPSCERITGYRADQFVANPSLLMEIIVPEDREKWGSHGHGSHEHSRKREIQFRIKRPDGDVHWIEHTCHPVFTGNNEFAGHRASNRDITRLKLAEQEASENREAALQLYRIVSLEQLAGSIAHELNQPLTGILGNAQVGTMLLAKGEGNSTEIKEIFTDIIADSKRSGAVIQNLQNMFRKQEVTFESICLNDVVDKVLLILKNELVNHEVSICLGLSDDLPNVMGNEVQIQQVFINLISNSMSSLVESVNENRFISIATGNESGSEVKIQVEDNGVGIDPQHLKTLFEPLITLKPGGLGMGLAISRSIIRTHGGRIWAENVTAGGVRVIFTLLSEDRRKDRG